MTVEHEIIFNKFSSTSCFFSSRLSRFWFYAKTIGLINYHILKKLKLNITHRQSYSRRLLGIKEKAKQLFLLTENRTFELNQNPLLKTVHAPFKAHGYSPIISETYYDFHKQKYLNIIINIMTKS